MIWAMNSKRTIKWKLFHDEAAYQLWNHVKSTEDFELLFLIARLYLFETQKLRYFDLIIRRNLVQIVRCLKKKTTVTDKALEMNPCLTEKISGSVRAINIYWQFNYFFHCIQANNLHLLFYF